MSPLTISQKIRRKFTVYIHQDLVPYQLHMICTLGLYCTRPKFAFSLRSQSHRSKPRVVECIHGSQTRDPSNRVKKPRAQTTARHFNPWVVGWLMEFHPKSAQFPRSQATSRGWIVRIILLEFPKILVTFQWGHFGIFSPFQPLNYVVLYS